MTTRLIAFLVAILGLGVTLRAEPPKKLDATTARNQARETLASATAVDAAVWGYPIVVMYNLRYNDALGPNAKAAPNSLWRMENISTPKLSEDAGYVTPNVNTVYGFGFLDLGPEPIVLTVPDSRGRYYMVEIVDLWTNTFAYVGGTATGYGGGKFALVAPGWKGELPAGVKRIDSPTRWILVQPRVHLFSQPDLPEAKKVLNAITVQGLAKFTDKPAPPPLKYNYAAPVLTNPKLSASVLDFKDPLQFWEILSAAMNENPPPADQIAALVPLFKQLGLEQGKVWDRATVDPITLKAMAKAAADVPEVLNHTSSPGALYAGGWFSSPPWTGEFKTQYLSRAVIARSSLTANVPREAVYLQAYRDRNEEVLTGAKRYTVTFKEPPPFHKPGFWSLTMYDLSNNYTVPNKLDRYCLGSDNKDMKLNADGSLTIYVQKDSPGADKEANWLPAPAGEFYMAIRSYVPGEAMVRSLTDPTAYPRPVIAPVK